MDRKTIALVIARWLKGKSPEMLRAMKDAERTSAHWGVAIAKNLSKGPFTSAHLKAMGHPYSKRKNRPPQDPAIINKQSGFFLSAWVARPTQQAANSFQTRIENFAPYAEFLHRGTDRMIQRPILERIAQKLRPFRRKTLADAMRRVLR